jgi:hypothetical protein
VVTTPDRLQEHLATLFTTSYETPRPEEPTKFSNFRHGLRRRGHWWGRLLGP